MFDKGLVQGFGFPDHSTHRLGTYDLPENDLVVWIETEQYLGRISGVRPIVACGGGIPGGKRPAAQTGPLADLVFLDPVCESIRLPARESREEPALNEPEGRAEVGRTDQLVELLQIGGDSTGVDSHILSFQRDDPGPASMVRLIDELAQSVPDGLALIAAPEQPLHHGPGDAGSAGPEGNGQKSGLERGDPDGLAVTPKGWTAEEVESQWLWALLREEGGRF